AQQPAMPVIGFLSSRSPEDSAHLIPAFAAGLAEGGYVEGQNLAIEFRWARGRYDLLPAMAAELVTRRVAVLTTAGGEPSALAAKRATCARPGREFQSSRRQRDRGYPADKSHGAKAARAAARARARRPGHRRFAQPEVCAGVATVAAGRGARSIDQRILVAKASTDEELETAFAAFTSERVGALLITADPYFDTRRDQIVGFAA